MQYTNNTANKFDSTELEKLIQRPFIDSEDLNQLVKKIFSDIKKNGDESLKYYTYLFDKVKIDEVKIDKNRIKNPSGLSDELKEAMNLAKNNIEIFHKAQIQKSVKIETSKGVNCWREDRPIEKIGIYVPGGTAPLLSTVLMLGVPAKIAGCKEIILCTPPDKNGNINPAILFAAELIGIETIFKVGGIQAIAALTFGTESIPKADKIFGPGNQYVTAAKQEALKYGMAIDMPAGPSEVLIIADESGIPEFIAADLLSQAEHGTDSQVILLSDNEEMIKKSLEEIQKQLNLLPRKTIARKALENSRAILLNNIEECIELSNNYAPEHLILALKKPEKYLRQISNAGSVFIGNYSCESAGDYASGTNHTLPTNGFAKNYSGVSVESFMKKITFQEISKAGLERIGPAIEMMAEAEQLMAHKNAVSIRLNQLKSLKSLEENSSNKTLKTDQSMLDRLSESLGGLKS
ncbi:MAG: histidinol dehydrogenase [Bacteroidetes bacterium HGW-Bacteroidetes-17]|jgi:histidinol dehydrogenase|nr:MAG: histidinol dehydrogenase [Bacteroidetes bacterium HGW-Bacteroidetes-17]